MLPKYWREAHKERTSAVCVYTHTYVCGAVSASINDACFQLCEACWPGQIRGTTCWFADSDTVRLRHGSAPLASNLCHSRPATLMHHIMIYSSYVLRACQERHSRALQRAVRGT